MMITSTFFQGAFQFPGGRRLNENQYRCLLLFSLVPRYKRSIQVVDPLRELVDHPFGPEGAYFVNSKEFLDLPSETQVR
jgi:hypothetical protein